MKNIDDIHCFTEEDTNKRSINPVDYSKGIKPFLTSANGMNQLCEFLARYVRKLHSDRYLKNILRQNIGTSFLDIIGPNNVAYVISLLKNSKEVWLQAPQTEDDEVQEGKKKRKKPVFTAGEGKKHV